MKTINPSGGVLMNGTGQYLLIAALALLVGQDTPAAVSRTIPARQTTIKLQQASPSHPDVLQTQDLSTGQTLEDIIAALVGSSSIAISNVRFTGSDSSLGTFTGGNGIIGFEQGIVLSSGRVADVVGPNTQDNMTTSYFRPGDADLDSLLTEFQLSQDACVLEFDFECPAVREIGFEYVFSSEEYNEFVNNSFNDVFGFFVNGTNVALLPDGQTIVSINNVNGGNPLGDSATNPQYYINNDECQFTPVPSCPVNTEMDGLTVVLIAEAKINPGLNHIKLAVADVADNSWDSNVFLKGQSFVCGAVNNTSPVCEIDPPGPITVVAGADVTFTVSGTDADSGQAIYLSVLFNIPSGATMTPPLPRAGSNTGLSSEFNWQPTQPGTYFANFLLTDSLGGTDSCQMQIDVTSAINNAPTCALNPPGPLNITVGANLSFDVTGTDPDDGQTIYLHSLGNLPIGATMTPSLPRAGARTGLTSQFSWTPSQAGVFTASFYVTDSLGGADTAAMQITVTSPQINTPPTCVINPPGPYTVNAGTVVTFGVSASDPDTGQIIRLSTFGTPPTGATMTPALPVFGPWTGVSSQFSWTPSQVGTFLARFSASDSSGGFDSISARINVLEGTAPRVTDVSPADGVVEVPWNTPVIVEFSESVLNTCNLATSPIPCLTLTSRRMGVVDFTQSWDGTILLIRPDPTWPDDDAITVTLSGEIRDGAGNRLDGDGDGIQEGFPTDNYSFVFYTAPGVYPGDANDDGHVDERDVLPLGVHFLVTGQSRQRNFDSWSLERASAWIPYAATHADCDGNGVVDSTDVCTILEFFDREIPAKRVPATHQFAPLSFLDEGVRESLIRALVECNNGSQSARTALLEALDGQAAAHNQLPRTFNLDQNYPNPFNAGTMIRWEMDAASHVELTVFDILGRRVRTLIDDERFAGFYSVEWNGRSDDGVGVASGIYFYRLATDKLSETKRMVLIR